MHLKTQSTENSNRGHQCNYKSSETGDLRRHLKTHGGEMDHSDVLFKKSEKKTYKFIRYMEVKVYNLIRQTLLKVANNLLMLCLSIFRHKLFHLQACHNQAHIVYISGIIIYFFGTDYLYAPPLWELFPKNTVFLKGIF